MLAIWIGFVLLSVGQPFGCVANVAAIPTAATTASVMVVPAITSGLRSRCGATADAKEIVPWSLLSCLGRLPFAAAKVVPLTRA